MLRIYTIAILLLAMAISACAASKSTDEIVAKLAQDFPKMEILEIGPAPVNGLYEVVLQNEDILYYASEEGIILVGELWTPDARNLTSESKSKRMSSKIDMFPLDKAIKIGDGPHVVIEVTDPDCPFCRKGSAFFDEREDVTRYVFLYPLTKLHPKSEDKSRYILSDEDPAIAYEEVFSGLYDSDPLPEFEDNGLLEEHRAIIKKVGISGTPQYWIDGEHVSGFNEEKFEQLMKD
jgi:thiol:disulfide interchange protein DsbC